MYLGIFHFLIRDFLFHLEYPMGDVSMNIQINSKISLTLSFMFLKYNTKIFVMFLDTVKGRSTDWDFFNSSISTVIIITLHPTFMISLLLTYYYSIF